MLRFFQNSLARLAAKSWPKHPFLGRRGTCALALGIAFNSAFVAQAVETSHTPPTQAALVADINADHSPLFLNLFAKWEKSYGTSSVHPLIAIARDKRNSDRARYIATMGAAKLGGPATAPFLTPLLRDRVWLIRSAALRALSALKNPKTAAAVLPLMKDPALVVRLEAVEAVRELKPVGASRALITALQSQENYRYGKSQWVPVKSLQALAELAELAGHDDPNVVSELKPLLDHRKDPELQKQAMLTLEALTGHKTNPALPLDQQIAEWKKYP